MINLRMKKKTLTICISVLSNNHDIIKQNTYEKRKFHRKRIVLIIS